MQLGNNFIALSSSFKYYLRVTFIATKKLSVSVDIKLEEIQPATVSLAIPNTKRNIKVNSIQQSYSLLLRNLS